MGERLGFNYLVNTLKEHIKDFPDKRTGKNCKFSLEDISLSAFSVFFTLSPSFLAHQKLMYNAKRKSNAQTIFQIKDIPSDNHIRDILDYVKPKAGTSVLCKKGIKYSRNYFLQYSCALIIY